MDSYKRGQLLISIVSGIYWPVVLAIFLLWGFLGKAWSVCWVVWPVAGVLFGAFATINNIRLYRNSK